MVNKDIFLRKLALEVAMKNQVITEDVYRKNINSISSLEKENALKEQFKKEILKNTKDKLHREFSSI
ncbi:hypothetical protein P4571_06745 [Niallia alba]|uniref:hypothetical protein n=1 Tax=Niallia alba TaxID=2729105 RepID=UPI002E1DF3EB|nr:hypothetical protein [Niallia alba]